MARQLLADAGFADGFSIETIIITGENDAGINIGQNLQAQLAEIGVDLELQQLETNVYVDRWLAADFDSALSENGAGPDPHHTYTKYFTSTRQLPKRRRVELSGTGSSCSPRARQRPIPRRGCRSTTRSPRILLDESPWVWLFQGYRSWVRVPELEGFVPHPTGSIKSLRSVTLTSRRPTSDMKERHRERCRRRSTLRSCRARWPSCVTEVGRVPRGIRVGIAARRQADEPETVFDLASLTKPLVGATVTLALVDRGSFSLDEEITKFLPELESFRAQGVTFRRLLAHTPGGRVAAAVTSASGTNGRSLGHRPDSAWPQRRAPASSTATSAS